MINPQGLLLFSLWVKSKKKIGHKKLGHTGTLDKFATGLLVVLAGSFTRLNPYFTNLDKTYKAVFTFGKETATLDPEGEIIKTGSIPSFETIKKTILTFLGEQEQVPPDFSAVHINGKRAYKRKLDGEDFQIPSRKISIYSYDIIDWNSPRITVRIRCSKGTYIRSLARDLGIKTESCCFVSELTRETVGPCSLEDSVTPENFCIGRDIINREDGFKYLPGLRILKIKDCFQKKLKNGVPFQKEFCINAESIHPNTNYALFCNDQFMGILESMNDSFRYGFIVGDE